MLSPEAAAVWRRCDGRTPAAGLRAQLGLDADTIDRALAELAACELLVVPEPPGEAPTRRELAAKMVRAGGAVAAAPLIVSIAAPTPAAAQSVPPGCELVVADPPCSGNCGESTGCQASGTGVGCTCCNLECSCNNPNQVCTCMGQRVSAPANLKRCVLGGIENCPADDNQCLCTTPC